MKTFLKEIIGFTIIMAMPKVGYAYDFEADGIYYNLNISDRTATVTSGDYKNKRDIIIPSSVFYANQELPVSAIGSSAFYGCSSLVSIEMPNSVTSIGYDSFRGCSSLVSIEIPNSVTVIGISAFEECSSLVSIEIPNSVTSIGYSAFSGCSSLVSIEIPQSVTDIGDAAFAGCSSLVSIEIPNSVTSIGYSAFSRCSSLVSIEIPNSVTDIGEYAFRGCSSLVSIEIPNSVTGIGEFAFSGCSSLVSIEIPQSVKTIGYEAFDKCSSLKKLVFKDGETKLSLLYTYQYWVTFKDSPIEELYLGRNLDYPTGGHNGDSPFYKNTGFKTISLGNYVTNADSIYPQKIESLEVINCYNPEPPFILSFTNVQYATIIVNVPKGCLEVYQTDSIWGKFWNLNEVDWEAGVETVESDSQLNFRIEESSIILDNPNNNKLITVYNLNGQCLYSGYDSVISDLPNGLLLIKIGNQSKKIFIP